MMLASPVLFLHATAHKNDILMAAVTFSALMWLGRYAVHGGAGSAIVGVVRWRWRWERNFTDSFWCWLDHAAVAGMARCIWRPTPGPRRSRPYGRRRYSCCWGAPSTWRMSWRRATRRASCRLRPECHEHRGVPGEWQVPRFIWMLLTAPLLSGGHYFRVPWSSRDLVLAGLRTVFLSLRRPRLAAHPAAAPRRVVGGRQLDDRAAARN